MLEPIATDNTTALLGLGLTGWSCARYLHERGLRFAVFDSGIGSDDAANFAAQFPGVPLFTGDFEFSRLQAYRKLLVSPGISLQHEAIRQALEHGAQLLSDIDLLLIEIDVPVIAITGSNAKTTVTTLVGMMAEAAGLRVAVGGNIGVPVLDYITGAAATEGPYDLYVLELSSFQLERCGVLAAQAATVLNVSPDHLDRHSSLLVYQQAKQAVYRACRWAVFNRQDKLTWPLLNTEQQGLSFGQDRPDLGQFGLHQDGEDTWLARGNERLLNAREMKIYGRHNQLNALAALALGSCAGFDMPVMLQVLREFGGLPHRCQWLGQSAGVQLFNDSKGTNVGATLAALTGLSRTDGDIVLIAGGVGKGADFSELGQAQGCLKGLVVMGQAAAQIAAVFDDSLPCIVVADMPAAVAAAMTLASSGDSVLLSPACASFDMYQNYEARGEHFAQLVSELPGVVAP
jgi:UDP-N-acetylmuramoylalanine--D-glutamate ligase